MNRSIDFNHDMSSIQNISRREISSGVNSDGERGETQGDTSALYERFEGSMTARSKILRMT
jgi:hypothetical protein